MKFVGMDELRVGMRLARPIYNKKGVLLFERDSKLTGQAIDSIRNFGLLGVYILEPTEPPPPMSEDDLEFERFQIMSGFSIQDELEKILSTGRQSRLQSIVAMIVKKYGHLDNKINFYQNLRSKDDFVSRHSLNVAILCTMITHVMNVRLEEQHQTVMAAIVHDLGKLKVPDEILYAAQPSGDRNDRIYLEQTKYMDVIERAMGDGMAIRRICMQALRAEYEFSKGALSITGSKLVTGAKILLVANRYDELTGMNLQGTSESEISAIRLFNNHPEIYDPVVVDALIRSVNILFPGVSVELSTGDKALVLSENREEILKPTVLCFSDNSILDLSLAINSDIKIIDVMKTMDNRYIMDTETVKRVGN